MVGPSGGAVWTPGMAQGSGATELVLQADCNLVLKDELKVLWASGTKCSGQLTSQKEPTSRTQEPSFYVLRNIPKSAGWMVDVAAAVMKAVPQLNPIGVGSDWRPDC